MLTFSFLANVLSISNQKPSATNPMSILYISPMTDQKTAGHMNPPKEVSLSLGDPHMNVKNPSISLWQATRVVFLLVVEPSKITFLMKNAIPQKEDIILLYSG